jgi:hypothetical protein
MVQIIEFRAAPGRTLTAKVFVPGSDTVVQTASAVVEATNRLGTYAATFTDLTIAEYEIIGFSSTIPVSRWMADVTTNDGTFESYEKPATYWTKTRAGYLDAAISSRMAAASYTAPPSAVTNATAVRTELTTELARIDAAISTRLAATSYTAPDNASIGSIKAVTDKLNTTLAADGLLWQFTINALENAPGGGGGGSATLENQELILANLDNVTGAVAAAVARLQLETQITGFPATLCRGSDYDVIIESEIRLQIKDLNDNPITEIGGVPVDEITWLFGFGTDRQPRLVEAVCSWDDVTDELVIELDAADTMDTPLGAATWQIGAQIGDLVRWLGGGTTRIIERQFAA